MIPQEIVEVETPKGIRVRLVSSHKDLDELCVRVTELISFVENINNPQKNGGYVS